MHAVSDTEWKTQIDSLHEVKDYQKQQKIILLQNYSLCGLAINIASFSHILKELTLMQ